MVSASVPRSPQNDEGQNQDLLRLVAVVFENLSRAVFLLTLLLFSLGWGFIRPSLRIKEAWVVSGVIKRKGLTGLVGLARGLIIPFGIAAFQLRSCDKERSPVGWALFLTFPCGA